MVIKSNCTIFVRMQYIPDIKAEFLLNSLYPEYKDKWVTYFDGTFYRNYNSDVLEVYEVLNEVHVSRDSILRLLPEGMLNNQYGLKGTSEWRGKWEKQKKDIEILKCTFTPIDSFLFRESLKLEDKVTEIIDSNSEILFKEIFDIDIESVTNPFVKSFALMLPFIELFRANYGFIARILSELLSCQVNIEKRSYSDYDTTISSIPCIELKVVVDNLDEDGYGVLRTQLNELQEFLREWYIPFDTHFVIEITGESNSLLADYNLIVE